MSLLCDIIFFRGYSCGSSASGFTADPVDA